MNSDEALIAIRKLTKAQQMMLSQICLGDDSGLHHRTALALARRGLIDYRLVPQGGGFNIWRADVASIPVHMAWCKWCDQTCTEVV